MLLAQEFLHRRGKLGVEIARKGVTWVVDENADEHNRIVLHMRRGFVRFGEEFADQIGRFAGRIGTGLGTLDDTGKTHEFGSML